MIRNQESGKNEIYTDNLLSHVSINGGTKDNSHGLNIIILNKFGGNPRSTKRTKTHTLLSILQQ